MFDESVQKQFKKLFIHIELCFSVTYNLLVKENKNAEVPVDLKL